MEDTPVPQCLPLNIEASECQNENVFKNYVKTPKVTLRKAKRNPGTEILDQVGTSCDTIWSAGLGYHTVCILNMPW